MSAVRPFDPSGSPFDTSTYAGRVRHFFQLVDPRNLLISDARLAGAQALLRAHASGSAAPPASDAALWEAKLVRDAVLHPDTGAPIPLPFRMAAFMPSNLPIVAGMLLSGAGAGQLVFQALNQSYNAGFNYANRNASAPSDPLQLAASYGVATSVAVGASYGFGRVIERFTARAAAAGGGGGLGLKLFTRAAPWCAVATAGVVNALAMRYKDGM